MGSEVAGGGGLVELLWNSSDFLFGISQVIILPKAISYEGLDSQNKMWPWLLLSW